MGQHIVLMVTGGIAAYKVPTIIRQLVKAHHDVRVAMTKHAQHFVTAETLAVVSGHQVIRDDYLSVADGSIGHLELALWADCVIVVPTTANRVAHFAQGLADDVVDTIFLAATCTKFIVPAMNDHMYLNPATQRQLTTLATDGVIILGPVTGDLAEGYAAIGRMLEPDQILAALNLYWQRQRYGTPLTGKQVIVTAGGTREELDPVRYIGNHSSGKMGHAFAERAWQLGAKVTLITSHPESVSSWLREHITLISVTTAKDVQTKLADTFKTCDYLIMAAAIADYRPAHLASEKIKKIAHATGSWQVELVENPDILASIIPLKTTQYVLGFAAETQQVLEHATQKLEHKQLDAILANQVGKPGTGFNAEENEATLLRPHQQAVHFNKQSKHDLALQVWQEILKDQK